MSSKLNTLASKFVFNSSSNPYIIDEKDFYVLGFKEAFKIIDESINKEIQKIEEYPWMGERIHTLKLYQKKINDVLKDMEQDYE